MHTLRAATLLGLACVGLGPTPAAAARPAPPIAPTPAPKPTGTPAELLDRAREAYGQLEYDQVAPLAQAVVDDASVPIETKLDAYVLLASSLAVIGDPILAESPFRLLLRARPAFDLPAETPPKILAVFRKVQTEERALADELSTVERRRRIAQLELSGEPAAELPGGRPVTFLLRLRDPTGLVDSVMVPYRRRGEGDFSTLALRRADDGSWHGTLPAEYTASEAGFALEYYVETRDRAGPLLRRGEPATPLAIAIAPGEIEVRPPLPRWLFWTSASGAVLLGVAGGGLGLAARSAQDDYAAYAAQGTSRTIDGGVLAEKASSGRALADGATWTLVGAGVFAVATAVAFPFTDWRADDAPAP